MMIEIWDSNFASLNLPEFEFTDSCKLSCQELKSLDCPHPS